MDGENKPPRHKQVVIRRYDGLSKAKREKKKKKEAQRSWKESMSGDG